MSETIYRLRVDTYNDDDFGDEVPDWDNATRTRIAGARFAPDQQGENRRDRNEIGVTKATVYLPPGTDFVITDRVEARGVTWLVDGDPNIWTTDPSATGGSEIPLRKVNE